MKSSKDPFIFGAALQFIALWSFVNSDVMAPLGTGATLNCRIEGVPLDSTTMVVWAGPREETLTINGDLIKTEDPRFSISKPFHNEFNLHIKNVKMSDQGAYSCKAFKLSNIFLNTTVNLVILVPPKARTPQNTSISVTEGEEVILECYGDGVPKPELDWKYHKKDTSVEETIIMENTSKYVIKNITLKQSGHYECQASNNVPPISSVHFYVDVLSKPRVHVPYVRVFQKVGHYVFLQCLITWNPEGDVQWEHDNAVINDVKSHEPAKYRQSIHKMEGNTWTVGLFVHQFDIADSGRYKCHARNKYGTKHGFIDVAAYHSAGGVEEAEIEQTISASPGEDAVLQCDGNNRNHPVSWSRHTISMKDFEVIQPIPSSMKNTASKYKLLADGSLQITVINKHDQGLYFCASKTNSTKYLSVSELGASTSCGPYRGSLKTVVIAGIIFIVVLCIVFAVLVLTLRHKYRRHLDKSGESILQVVGNNNNNYYS